jgi:hypothetical protein
VRGDSLVGIDFRTNTTNGTHSKLIYINICVNGVKKKKKKRFFSPSLSFISFIAFCARGCPYLDVTLGTNGASLFILFFFCCCIYFYFTVKPRQARTDSLTLPSDIGPSPCDSATFPRFLFKVVPMGSISLSNVSPPFYFRIF